MKEALPTLASWRPPAQLVDLGAGLALPHAETREAVRVARAALARDGAALLVRPSPRAQAVLAELPPNLPALAVLPDMAQLLRDAAERGAAGAILGRLRAGGAAAWWRLARTAVQHARALAAQDFSGIVPVLVELDRGGLRGTSLAGIALAASLTDLLLAAGHVDCLSAFVRFGRTRVGVAAGFETQNLGHLLRRLRAWGATADFVLGPFNSRGHHMKPTASVVRDAVAATTIPVIATEVSAAGSIALDAAIGWARSHGAAGVGVTLEELGARPAE